MYDLGRVHSLWTICCVHIFGTTPNANSGSVLTLKVIFLKGIAFFYSIICLQLYMLVDKLSIFTKRKIKLKSFIKKFTNGIY